MCGSPETLVYDGTAWNARTPERPSFGLQLGEQNDIPFETGTAGATFWVRDAGCPPALAAFGSPCGWKLAFAVTQYRSVVVGGNGIEIDGLTLRPPYGRLVNANDGASRRIGLTSNIYADWSGADVPAQPRWFAGFDLSNDRFEIARGTKPALASLVTVDAGGTLSSQRLAARRLTQQAPAQYATRARLQNGTLRFAFETPYRAVPVCTASSEGSAAVHVRPALDACTIVSSDPSDTATVDVTVVGNPN